MEVHPEGCKKDRAGCMLKFPNRPHLPGTALLMQAASLCVLHRFYLWPSIGHRACLHGTQQKPRQPWAAQSSDALKSFIYSMSILLLFSSQHGSIGLTCVTLYGRVPLPVSLPWWTSTML